MLLAYDYPLLDVFVTILSVALFAVWLMLLVITVSDLLRDPDASGVTKGLWLFFMFVLPYIGVLTYIAVRGTSMTSRAVAWA